MAPAIRPHKPLGAQLYDGVRGVPGALAVQTIYTALADKPDVSVEQLLDLSNRLGRLAHARARAELDRGA